MSGPALGTDEITRARLRLPVCKKGVGMLERNSEWYAAAAFLGSVNIGTRGFTEGLGARLLSGGAFEEGGEIGTPDYWIQTSEWCGKFGRRG